MTNSRFEDLEKRVIKIKIKKYLKIFFLLVVFLAVLIYAINSNFSLENILEKPLHVEVVEKQEVLHVQTKEVNNTVIKVDEKVDENVYDTIKLSPTIFLPNMQDNGEVSQKNNVQEVKSLEVSEPIVEKNITQKKNINFNIKEVKSEEALLERFSLAGDYESAVGLANLYFEKGKFEKAIYWSKKASKINAEAPNSWIVYAKSKVELGQKEDAIKSLELYLNYFSSDEIAKLLSDYKGAKK